MNKFTILFLSLTGLLFSNISIAQSYETAKKRQMESIIEKGSGSFYINDEVGIGTTATYQLDVRASGSGDDTIITWGNNNFAYGNLGVDSSGNATIGRGPTQRDLAISSAGNVGIGTTAASTQRLAVDSNYTSGLAGYFKASNGSFTGNVVTIEASQVRSTGFNFLTATNTTATDFIIQGNGDVQNRNNSYTGISDYRLKINIIDAPSYLSRLMKTKVRNFNWKDDNKSDVGVIAQELESIFPEFVKTNNDDFKTKAVIYSKFTPIIIKVIQEQQEIIDAQKNEIGMMKSWICSQPDSPLALCG